jgi:hypothetical protein
MRKKMKQRTQDATEGLQHKEVFQSEKLKSKTTLFWEKYPKGILHIVDRKAVLR